MWSDGTPFTAHDVVYTINHLIEIGGEVRFGNEVQQYTEGGGRSRRPYRGHHPKIPVPALP